MILAMPRFFFTRQRMFSIGMCEFPLFIVLFFGAEGECLRSNRFWSTDGDNLVQNLYYSTDEMKCKGRKIKQTLEQESESLWPFSVVSLTRRIGKGTIEWFGIIQSRTLEFYSCITTGSKQKFAMFGQHEERTKERRIQCISSSG